MFVLCFKSKDSYLYILGSKRNYSSVIFLLPQVNQKGNLGAMTRCPMSCGKYANKL